MERELAYAGRGVVSRLHLLKQGLCVRLGPIKNFQWSFTTRGSNHVTYGSKTAARHKHFLEGIQNSGSFITKQVVFQDV